MAQQLLVRPESEDLRPYLADEAYLDIFGPMVRAKGEELFTGISRDADKIKAVFDYVAGEIPHSADINGRYVSKTANDVLQYKQGMCYAKSMLVAALLRGQGIPAGFAYQKLLRGGSPGSPYAIHCLNAAYLTEFGTWALLDARGNNDRVKASFDADSPFSGRLAYPPRETLGELTYPVIYAKPPKVILETLQRFDDCQIMFQYLPDSL